MRRGRSGSKTRRRVPAWLRHQARHAAAFARRRLEPHAEADRERFQPLMMLITSVSFTCSSSENWALSAS